MSSASDLVSLEQDTGLVKKMHERYILIWNLSKPTQTMIALIVTRLSEDDHLHAGTQQKFPKMSPGHLGVAEVVSRWFPVFGTVKRLHNFFRLHNIGRVFLFRASKSREAVRISWRVAGSTATWVVETSLRRWLFPP